MHAGMHACSHDVTAANEHILQDTSDTCVNFALRGGCETDQEMASKTYRA
jgi:hypothetical protein